MSISSEYPLHDATRGTSFHQRKDYDFSVPALDFMLANDVVGPVGTLDENVRMNLQDRVERRVLVEQADKVDHLKAVEKFGTFVRRNNGSVRTFYTNDRSVTVDCNHQDIA